jgi:hypothetical protein
MSEQRDALTTEYKRASTAVLESWNRLRRPIDIAALRFSRSIPDDASGREAVALSEFEQMRATAEDAASRLGVIAQDASERLADFAIEQAASGALQSATNSARQFGNAQLAAAVASEWRPVDAEFLAESANYAVQNARKTARYGDDFGQLLAGKTVEIVDSRNRPLSIAAGLNTYANWPAAWANSNMITTQFWTYRLALQAQFAQNGAMFDGWMWIARLDAAVCMSCVNLHGRVFGINTLMRDHWYGRCLPLPVVTGTSPVVQSGHDWFRGLTAGQQARMMGRSAWSAWRAGEFTLDEFTRQTDDGVYGAVLREASLREIMAARRPGSVASEARNAGFAFNGQS